MDRLTASFVTGVFGLLVGFVYAAYSFWAGFLLVHVFFGATCFFFGLLVVINSFVASRKQYHGLLFSDEIHEEQ